MGVAKLLVLSDGLRKLGESSSRIDISHLPLQIFVPERLNVIRGPITNALTRRANYPRSGSITGGGYGDKAL